MKSKNSPFCIELPDTTEPDTKDGTLKFKTNNETVVTKITKEHPQYCLDIQNTAESEKTEKLKEKIKTIVKNIKSKFTTFCPEDTADSDYQVEEVKKPKTNKENILTKFKSEYSPLFVSVSTLAIIAITLLVFGLITTFNSLMKYVIGVSISIIFMLLFMKGVVHFTSMQERRKVLPYSGFNINAVVTSRQKRRDRAGCQEKINYFIK